MKILPNNYLEITTSYNIPIRIHQDNIISVNQSFSLPTQWIITIKLTDNNHYNYYLSKEETIQLNKYVLSTYKRLISPRITYIYNFNPLAHNQLEFLDSMNDSNLQSFIENTKDFPIILINPSHNENNENTTQ